MSDNFTKIAFDRILRVDSIITIFYMELSKNFSYSGESHDFYEMVYIDKGEMLCTADQNRFILKSGEMTFHKPNEYHNLSGNNTVAPNVSILTFSCKSRAMRYLEGKIFKLDAQEKSLLSQLFAEGLSCYRLVDERNPLLQQMKEIKAAPFGSSQLTQNLLESFLIRLCRRTDAITKAMRQSFLIDGMDVPMPIKEVMDYLQSHVYGRITIGEVAHHIGKSESSVKQQFARFHPGGILHYYNGLKIKEARRLIREGQYNMTQIADMLCFDNPQYFSRCFKAFTQMSPREYKTSILQR